MRKVGLWRRSHGVAVIRIWSSASELGDFVAAISALVAEMQQSAFVLSFLCHV